MSAKFEAHRVGKAPTDVAPYWTNNPNIIPPYKHADSPHETCYTDPKRVHPHSYIPAAKQPWEGNENEYKSNEVDSSDECICLVHSGCLDIIRSYGCEDACVRVNFAISGRFAVWKEAEMMAWPYEHYDNRHRPLSVELSPRCVVGYAGYPGTNLPYKW